MINEGQLREHIENLVRESLESYFVDETKKKETKKHSSKKDKVSNKRKIVLNWLKNDSVNCAEIMRQLWDPKTKDEEDAKRSFFYKKRDNKPNDEGVPYQFSDKEINQLYRIKSNN